MFPTFVAAEDFNLNPQKIDRHLQFRISQTRHPHRIFLRGHDHRKIAADTTLDKADQFRLGIIVVIDVALGQIDMRPEFPQRVLEACSPEKTFWRWSGL